MPGLQTTTLCNGYTNIAVAPIHEILYQPTGCRGKDQGGAWLHGLATCVPFVFGSCGCNAQNALVLRHCVAQPVIKRNLGLFYDVCLEPFVAERPWEEYGGFEDWILRWPLSKRLMIRRSMLEDEVRHNRLRAMIKREIYHARPRVARLIQYYPNLATQAVNGWLCSNLQKSLGFYFKNRRFDNIDITFASGLNGIELGEWMDRVYDLYGNPWFIESDGQRWDARMQRMHHDFKMRLYRVVDAELASSVEQGFACVGVVVLSDDRLVYRVNGTVKSGHNDTTLGNSLINAAVAYETCVLMNLKASIIVAGDDLLIACSGEPDLCRFDNIVLDYGIVPESRVFNTYRGVSFISGCWLRCRVGSRFIFVPKLGRLLARLWWSVSVVPERRRNDYRHSVCSGLRPLVGLLPIYSAFIDSHDCPGRIIPIDKQYSYITGVGCSVDQDLALQEICDRYNLAKCEVDVLHETILSLSGRKCLYRSYIIDLIEKVDLNDVGEREVFEGDVHNFTF